MLCKTLYNQSTLYNNKNSTITMEKTINKPPQQQPQKKISSVSNYYEFSKEQDYICSKPEDSGMHLCSDLPPYRVGDMICTGK